MPKVKKTIKASNQFKPNLTNEAQSFLAGSYEFKLSEIEVYQRQAL